MLNPLPFPIFPPVIHPALRAHAELLIDFHSAMLQRALESMQSLSELHLQLARDLIAESAAYSQRLVASSATAQLNTVLTPQFYPGAASLYAYQRHLADLLSRSNTSLAQTAAAHLPGVNRSANALTEQFAQRAKEETERAAEKIARFQLPASELRH